ncbi:YggS family pyridoxal phosphate-dependent enzyme [Peptoniphilaceae bacterium SGI.137]
MSCHQEIQNRIEQIQIEIEKHAAIFGHRPEDVTLVAVTKTVEEERIREAISCGIRNVGENRVQELNRKRDAFIGADIHMIGRLQKNKVRQLTESIALIQSIDSIDLLKEMERIGERDHCHFTGLVEINIAGELQKGGVAPENLKELLDYAEDLKRVHLRGLMTVAPNLKDSEETRPYFIKMRKIFENIGSMRYNNTQMNILSMGMSHDYQVALEEGANMVRIGSAIFGERTANA